MAPAKVDRNQQIRDRRARHRASTRQLAREFGVSQPRIVKILDETGGDPIKLERLEDLARASEDDLAWEKRRLEHRIGTDIRRWLAIVDELDVRGIDGLLGLN
jgi:transcriptional regulator with XRE-family HTH domain